MEKELNFDFNEILKEFRSGKRLTGKYPKREINKAQILSLAYMDFIRTRHNIIINGIVGIGKSTMAQAFWIRAIQSGFTVYYTRTATLLEDIKFGRIDGSYTNLVRNLQDINF